MNWIDANDGRPAPNQQALVWVDNQAAIVHVQSDGYILNGLLLTQLHYTHWMPLPAPPVVSEQSELVDAHEPA